MNKRLDPDALAELEAERAFLLGSLDDLDAEYKAGDLDEDDYTSLTDDYTRRVAEVIRAIDERRAAFAETETKLSTNQRILTVVAIVAVAVLAGVLLARASGFRTPSGTVSGDIRRSSTGLLAEANTLTREGLLPDAVEVYDEVLDLTPANVEALTYRGWLTARLGDPEAGLADIGEAIALDPEYPDARVFNALLLDEAQMFDEAAAELDVLESLGAPDEMRGLVETSNLRASVTAGQIAKRFGAGDVVDLGLINASLEDVAKAGLVLESLDPLLALRVFDAVLAEDPDQLFALVGKGRRLAVDPDIFVESPELAADGLELLDRAVELVPDDAEVRFYRALARSVQLNPDAAQEDLDLIDRSALPPELMGLFDQLAAG